MPLGVDAGQELATLRAETKRLRKHNEDRKNKDTQLVQAKRQAAQLKDEVQRTREMWDAKVGAEMQQHAAAQREDVARIARYEKKSVEDARRIASLEQEIAALRATLAKVQAADESLAGFLGRLKLEAYLPAFQDEELDVALLRSMGSRDELTSNMAELGLTPAEAARVADALFPLASVV